MKSLAIKLAILVIYLLSLPVWAQLQNPSSGVYGITESTASDSQLFLKNTTTSGIARWQSIGGNGAVINQVIADPVTGLARFGSISSAIDVDLFTSRNLFLSNDNGAGPTPRFTLSSGGKIGINTITPQKVFEVQTLASDTAAFGRTLAVGEWTGIQVGYLEPWNSFYRKSAIIFQRTDATAARGKLMFLNNIVGDSTSAGLNDAKLTISDNGNVGIGTTTPSSKLHIEDSTGPVIRMVRTSNRFDIEVDSNRMSIGPRDSGDLVLTSGEFAEGLRLHSNGNIGIKNSAPSTTLDVNGTFRATGETTIGGRLLLQSGDIRVGAGVASPSVRWVGPNNWDMYLGVSTDKLQIRRNSDPKVTFSPDGTVGIGITTPSTKLHIKADSMGAGRALLALEDTTNQQDVSLELAGGWNGGVNGAARISVGRSTAGGGYAGIIKFQPQYYTGTQYVFRDAMVIDAGGNVGIGTTAPSTALHVDMASGPVIRLSRGNNGNRFDLECDGTNLMVGPRDSGDLVLTSGAFAEGVRLKSGGNVGIGTSCPTTKLEVNGTIKAQDMVVVVKTWADYVFEPTYKLRSIPELDSFVKLNKHLPDVPTEAEVKANGANVGDVQVALLRKIEELTLYAIQSQKEADKSNKNIAELQAVIKKMGDIQFKLVSENNLLKNRLDKLENTYEKRVEWN